MLRTATLASGSSGNCTLVSDGRVHILIDAGISARRIFDSLAELGIEPVSLCGIVITHEHSDHINGLQTLLRKVRIPLFAPEATIDAIRVRVPDLEPDCCWAFTPGDRFAVRDLVVGTFPNSHDAACPVGYTVSGGGRKMALCTDTGVITEQAWASVRGCGLYIGEFNHDIEMLKNGPYPAFLKARILGDRGHLCNEKGAELAVHAAESGCTRIVMAHLSEENNTPALARKAAESAFEAVGAVPGKDVEIQVAPRHVSSGWMEVPPC